MNFVFIGAGSIIDSTFALYASKAHDLGPQAVGFLFTYMGVIMAVVQGGAIGPLTSRFGDIAVAGAGVAFYVLGLVVLIPSTGLISLLAALSLLTTGVALFIPSTSSLVSKNAPESEQGAAIGVYQAAGNLGRVITPSFSGFIFSYSSPPVKPCFKKRPRIRARSRYRRVPGCRQSRSSHHPQFLRIYFQQLRHDSTLLHCHCNSYSYTVAGAENTGKDIGCMTFFYG